MGETYLTVDPSIKCEGLEASRWKDGVTFVTFMSILFPLGIPLYYMVALLGVINHVKPPMSAIFKDKDYVSAFAMHEEMKIDKRDGHRKYKDEHGTVWRKVSLTEK